jgi:4-carboxymuconolactone decarboxylase
MTTDAKAPRIAPLEAPFEPGAAAQLERWMPPGSGIEPLALFRTLVRHEALAARMRPLGAGILGREASVPIDLREVMIDRTCALAGAGYEWGVHVAAFAGAAGLDEEQVRSTATGSHGDACWDERQAAVMALAQELHDNSTISDALWERLDRLFSAEQVIEMIVTAGWYHVIAYICNGLRVPLEDWAARLPDAA